MSPWVGPLTVSRPFGPLKFYKCKCTKWHPFTRHLFCQEPDAKTLKSLEIYQIYVLSPKVTMYRKVFVISRKFQPPKRLYKILCFIKMWTYCKSGIFLWGKLLFQIRETRHIIATFILLNIMHTSYNLKEHRNLSCNINYCQICEQPNYSKLWTLPLLQYSGFEPHKDLGFYLAMPFLGFISSLGSQMNG